MSIAYLGLGSNLGNRENNIKTALELLNNNGIHTLDVASTIETKPVGGPPQGDYLNTVVKVETNLMPRELLATVLSIEKDMGRVRNIANGPRNIDIDILLYENERMITADLTLPHPRMHQRDFVLTPLKEIYPEYFLCAHHANN